MPVVATERYGSLESWKYQLKDGVMEREREGGDGGYNWKIHYWRVQKSVSGDYLQYQFWDTLQAFFSSLSGTLATQASLRGVGVGNQEATVAAATITWLLRDGTGMLGRIFFAWLKGNKLDSEAKKWRLVADVLNDIAMFMEILAPNFPTCFTLIVCSAGIFKVNLNTILSLALILQIATSYFEGFTCYVPNMWLFYLLWLNGLIVIRS
ncbi:unnamed protein product [Coregonus sp. 'balchen']|nr:unnamed protein product [Coregonus sp. 'balchen']